MENDCDRFKLQRFLDAQAHTYSEALREMKAGRKEGHWIWYIFPQIKGLGYSYNANYYGISGLGEAQAYLQCETLNYRLREITAAILELPTDNPISVFGGIDALKLRSSMTLFDQASPNDIYGQVLDKYFGGQRDKRTLSMLH